MKRLFFILPPVVVFIVFIFLYQGHVEKMVLDQKEKAALDAQKKKAEDARKLELKIAADKLAEEDKAKRQADIDKRKEEIRNAKEEAERKILNETESAIAEGKRLQALIIKLQSDIQTTRAARDKAQAEASDTRLDLEKAKIDKRNAEFEIQRFTEMLATRMAQSQAMVADVMANAGKKKP